MQSSFSKKLNFKRRRASLRSLLIYPFVILIVIAVVSTSFLSLYNSGKAVDTMAWQLMDEIAARIEGRVLIFLDRAHIVNEINANTIKSGQLNLKNIREQELHFWHQVRSFDYISYSYIGRADGGFRGKEACRWDITNYRYENSDGWRNPLFQYRPSGSLGGNKQHSSIL